MTVTSSEDQLRAALAALFSDAAGAVVRRFAEVGLPLTSEITQTVVVRPSVTEWRTDHRSEARNILATGPEALYQAPWLGDDEVASIFDCAAMIAENASQTLPFWAPFHGGLSGLVESITDRRTERPEYNQDLRGWVVRFVLLPALQWHLAVLPSVDTADETAARGFADEVIRAVYDDHVRYRLYAPLGGVDIDPTESDILTVGDLSVRRLSEAEQGAWFEQRGGISIDTVMNFEPPRVAFELQIAGPRQTQYFPEDGLGPRVAAALRLHGLEVSGRFGALYTDPAWMFPGSSGVSLMLPGRAGKLSLLSTSDLGEVVKTAGLLEGYNLDQPQSSQALALHRFITGASRENIADAVLDFTIALEALLLPYDKQARRGDLGYRFRAHGAHYLAVSSDDRQSVSKQLYEIYEMRSRLVHGGKYPASAALSQVRNVAGDFARRGLLRAVRHGFPNAEKFNEMILGLADHSEVPPGTTPPSI